MFTSRAEHRLLLNHGSAEFRLATHARDHGLISAQRLERVNQKRSRVEKWVNFFHQNHLDGLSWAKILCRGELTVPLPADFQTEAHGVREEVIYKIVYQGYMERELRQVEKMRHVEKVRIPVPFDYLRLRGLRRESALKLTDIQPINLGQASRISGVNPTDIGVLMIALAAGAGERPDPRPPEAPAA